MSKTAYPNTATAVSITLYCNIPFDNSYKHHPLISNEFKYNTYDIYAKTGVGGVPANESFLNRQDYSQTGYPYVYQRWTLTDVFNFDFKNGLLGSITLELTNAQTNANYMKVVAGSQTWFYFITGITQSNIDTYTLSLELDVLTTYQDEFLQGMKDIPVFTKRKHSHRYTNNGLMPYCADFKNNEDAFAGVKPTKITQLHKAHYKEDKMKSLEGVMWLYVCCTIPADTYGDIPTNHLEPVLKKSVYTCNGKQYPLAMLAIPLNVNSVEYRDEDNTHSIVMSHDVIIASIRQLIDDGSVHGAKISPYPPFTTDAHSGTSISNGNLVIYGQTSEVLDSGLVHIYQLSIGDSEMIYGKIDTYSGANFGKLLILMMVFGFIIISEQNSASFIFDEITPTNLGIKNNSAPSIYTARYDDPKLLFSPFRKYKINAQYSSEGSEFYPELYYCEYPSTKGFNLESIATAYIGDNNFYTKVWIDTGLIDNPFNRYQYEKIGLASSVNYIFPCGTNALDVFNSTQAQSFYQSKTASGITSALTIAGGIASVAGGVAMTAGSAGTASPFGIGLIASGATAIAGGVAGEVNTIASTQAKLEDLKNTPDSINISGSNFITDEFITYNNTNCLPYVVVYDVSPVIKENANNFFYKYGYQVSRECYFNTELKYDASTSQKIDNNLFGRTLFNFIQLQEDITNKINADIPYIAKKKISSIFNEGITLWSFFGVRGLWNNFVPTSTDYVENWLFKNYYDNTEYGV